MPSTRATRASASALVPSSDDAAAGAPLSSSSAMNAASKSSSKKTNANAAAHASSKPAGQTNKKTTKVSSKPLTQENTQDAPPPPPPTLAKKSTTTKQQQQQQQTKTTTATTATTTKPNKSRTPVQTSVASAFDACQRSSAAHRKCARMLVEARDNCEGDAFFTAFAAALHPVLLCYRRDPHIERLVRFVVTFATARPEGHEEEADAFVENLLNFLLRYATATDRAVRFRVAQVVGDVLNSLSDDASIDDDVWDAVQEGMLQRLSDKVPLVRAMACRALARLQDGGDDGDFADCQITEAFLLMLRRENNASVRKMALSSIVACDATVPAIVERTRDDSDAVRRQAYAVLSEKVGVENLTIAQRAAVLQRGLGDRTPTVKSACASMVKAWLNGPCDGDALKLLSLLDVETNEGAAAAALRSLLSDSVLDAIALAEQRPLKKDDVLTPEQALLARIVVEHLASLTEKQSREVAVSLGAVMEVAAAQSERSLDALEKALPESMADLVKLCAGPAAKLSATEDNKSAARFVLRQLLACGAHMETSDGASRENASKLLQSLLAEAPVGMASGDAPLAGDGGDGNFEEALAAFAARVHGAAEGGVVLLEMACKLAEEWKLEEEGGEGAHCCWVQVLTIIALAARIACAGGANACAVTLQAMEPALALARGAVSSEEPAVRAAAVRALGLHAQMASCRPALVATVPLLAKAVSADDDKVASAAADALGDLLLLFGVGAVDEAVEDGEDGGVVGVLASCVDGRGGDVRASASTALAKLVLCGRLRSAEEEQDSGVHATAEHVLGGLLLAWTASPEEEERLQQTLTVFFDTYAQTGAAHHRVMGRALLAPLRAALRAGRKTTTAMLKCARGVLVTPVAEGMVDSDLGHSALGRMLLAEALSASASKTSDAKAYVTGVSAIIGVLEPHFSESREAREVVAMADSLLAKMGRATHAAKNVRTFRDACAAAVVDEEGLTEEDLAIVLSQAEKVVEAHVEDVGAPFEEQ